MSIGLPEILLILAVILLLFGAKRIPELARSLGRASHEYKKAKNALAKESGEFMDAAEKSATAEAEKPQNETPATEQGDQAKDA